MSMSIHSTRSLDIIGLMFVGVGCWEIWARQKQEKPTFCTDEPLLLILNIVQLACMIATRTSAAMQATTTYSFTLGTWAFDSSRPLLSSSVETGGEKFEKQ